jgi:hypothetical protein
MVKNRPVVAEVRNTQQRGQRGFQIDEAENSPMLQEQRADQYLGVSASPNDNHWQVQGVLLIDYCR